MAPAVSPLMFTVRRKSPELIRPAKPTPKEYKLLSDIDDQEGLRFHLPMIHFYRHNPTMEGKDPVKVIREALAQALLFYYPFAGRLREGPGRKLMVDCTGEGVIFIEADADVALEDFGDVLLLPPCPCLEELLYDVPGSQGVLHSPLSLVQVTRLRCGGFIFAISFNHTMSDGFGIGQFMSAIGEIARGAASPSILPVWRRDLLSARDPPCICYNHQEYDQIPDTKATLIPLDHMIHLSFFFGPTEISAIRKLLPTHLLEKCSRFDILTACIWRCRTFALQPDPDEEVRALCILNARAKLNHPLPIGYYGNAVAILAAITTAEKLCNNPLSYAVELVMKAKSDVTEESIRSVADFLVIKGRPHFSVVRTFIVSDVTRAGLREVDFGWGDAVYAGPAKAGIGVFPGVSIFYIPFSNKKGESGTVVPVCLPALAMEKFINEINSILNPSKLEESIRKKKSAL